MLITDEEFLLLADLASDWYGSWEILSNYANKDKTHVLQSLKKLAGYGFLVVQKGRYNGDENWREFEIEKDVPIDELLSQELNPEYDQFWEPPANGVTFVVNCTPLWDETYRSPERMDELVCRIPQDLIGPKLSGRSVTTG